MDVTKNTTFPWVPYFKELAQKLLEYEDRQKELIAILEKIGVDSGLTDKEGDREFLLEEIDPFTFFSIINKYRSYERRSEFLQKLSREMGLETSVPESFDGVPVSQPVSARLFAPKEDREVDDIPKLWELFNKAFSGQIDDELFERCLKIRAVGKSKLTQNLYYVRPDTFFPVDTQTRPYLKKHGIDPQFRTYEEYAALLEKVKATFEEPFYELSYLAWESNQEKSSEPLQELIDHYKDLIREDQNEPEVYKWIAVQHFQDTFNLEAPDFGENLKAAISKQHNLIYHRAAAFIRKAAAEYPEEVRAMFRTLLNEDLSLPDRFQSFQSNAERIVERMKEKEGRQNIDHYQDERSMAFYLAMAYPEQHYLYKDEIYQAFCDVLEEKTVGAGEKYLHYCELAEPFRDLIEEDRELLDLSRATLPPNGYQGEQTHLLVQDILYRTLVQDNETSEEDTEQVFIKRVESFEQDDIRTFFQLLDEVLGALNAAAPDDTMVFGCNREDRLTLTIGQRYCLMLGQAVPQSRWCFITNEKITDEAITQTESFNGKPEAYFYYTGDPGVLFKNMNHIKAAVKQEHNRSSKSGFRQFNNASFSRAAFDTAYRKELFPWLAKNGSIVKFSANSLNQILYGPPGTGKTYQTKDLAVQILTGQKIAQRKPVNETYSRLFAEGRIGFVTFHQSMSYEDFLEGIKPDLEQEDETGEVKYRVEDGIFKRMCVQAAYEYIKAQHKEQAAARTLTFGQLFDELSNRFQQQLEEEGQQVFIPLKSGSQIEVKQISAQGNFILKHQDGQREYTVSKSRLEKLFNAIDDFDNIPNIYSYFRSIIGGSNASAYWAVLNQLYSLSADTVQDEKKPVAYEDKRAAFERINWRQMDVSVTAPYYVLIIDEINRGNIAAILGELITLLEPDKRGGEPEGLEVTLPYSKSKFSVPPNLYVIGTMNTADRSVEALDTALRRRFSFREVAPDENLLAKIEADGIDLVKLLTVINRRIVRLLDWDHQIGHAYFMGAKDYQLSIQDLKMIFHNKLLPLLQEYFYGNLGKVQLVLGRDFVEQDRDNSFSFAAHDEELNGEDYLERRVYRIRDLTKIDEAAFREAVLKIYQPNHG